MADLQPGLIVDIARAAGRKLTATAGSELLIQCPYRERHSHGDAHPSCRIHPDRNVYFCDPCGLGGGVKDLAEVLGVDLANLQGTKKGPAPKLPLVFVGSGPIDAETRRFFARELSKNYTEQTWQAFGVLQGKVYPEGKLDKAEPAVAFPLPNGGYHVYRYRRQNKKKRWCFANGGKSGLIVVGLDRSDPAILAEGEWDAMTAYEIGYAVATGTGAGTFRLEWATGLSGREVAVVYDVDAAGRQGAAKALLALSAAGCKAWDVHLPLSGREEEDGKDLSDFVAVDGAEAFRHLLDNVRANGTGAQASPAQAAAAGLAGSNPTELAVASAIDAILALAGPVRLKRREASRLVIEDLSRRGQLIRASGNRNFWFDRGAKQLFDLDGFEFYARMTDTYRINPSEPEFKHILAAVKSETLNRGKDATIVRFTYYDRRRGLLYIHAGQGRVLRLDGTSATWIDNGEDDLLFEDRVTMAVIPHEATTHSLTGDPLHDLVLGRVNFIRGSGVILDPGRQQLVLRVWILAVFFPELLPAKPLLLLYGEKGSGKSTTLRVILKILLGPKADVTPLGKEDGFNATVSQEYLIVLDNVDSYCKWIEDRLATVATGQTIKLRKLYTTNEVLSFPTRCCIGLTARTPRFRRDDVVDRLQILRVARLDHFDRESEWYAEIEQHRVPLWAQLLRELNAVVARLRETSVDAPDEIRMADWAFLATVIGDALGERENIRTALEDSELDKAHFLLESDDLYDLLHAIAHDHAGREWKAGELFGELKHRAEEAELQFGVKSPRSLGRILHRLESALKRMIRFEIYTSRHDGQASYTLGPLVSGNA